MASSAARRAASPSSQKPRQPAPAAWLAKRAGRSPAPTGPRSKHSGQPRRTYVLDTSVLLADPAAIGRFAEHRVVLPVVVITELEAKRHHPELGYFARQALRYLDDLRIEHGRLDADLPVGDQGGTVRVELNHADPSVLPAGFRLGDNDTRILSVARSLAAEGDTVVLVSKDLPLRVKAAAIGLTAQEYRAELPPDSGWTGMAELDVTARARSTSCTRPAGWTAPAARDLPCHTGLVLVSGDGRRGQRARPGAAGQVGQAGPRRPRGVRPARPQRRAARRARPAARHRGRDRVAGRPGRHGQVGARAVRRP